ncbi:hypothetical protein M9H77_27069 [Catharanthus roseus]|uniref:Uncharacterized protein n=1 Tax=Catharanthus roseus TaxID=4058 RepID=A0ACC0AFI7_CATRO|nr:hypothetical protein M9H77_27069 [Catharanthus roseus]
MDFGNDQMEIGYQYINSLLQTCLLQEVIDEDGESRCVGMHDLAGLISKSKNDHVALSLRFMVMIIWAVESIISRCQKLLFQPLRRLQLKTIWSLEEWMEAETFHTEAAGIFPNLEDLIIIDYCPRLRNIPIRHLHISPLHFAKQIKNAAAADKALRFPRYLESNPLEPYSSTYNRYTKMCQIETSCEDANICTTPWMTK